VNGRSPCYNATELERAFDSSGLEALVLRSGQNVGYLSGMSFPGTLGRHQDLAHSDRATMLVWPYEGEPTLVTSTGAYGPARMRSWLEDIRVYTDCVESAFTYCVKVLKERGLERGRIGVDRRWIGADRWVELVAELPHAELVECSELMDRVRNIKTPAEVALLRRAVDIQDEAHLEVFGGARPGDTEKELHSRMVAAMIRLGAESAHGMMQSSNTPYTYAGEGPVAINKGDALRTDYVCYLDGYAANLSRMAVMGPPSAEQERMYQLELAVHREIIASLLRPGIRVSEIHRYMRERFTAEGFPDVIGLAGHSIGVWWHQEEPLFSPGEERELQTGMVVCLEPVLKRFWHVQD